MDDKMQQFFKNCTPRMKEVMNLALQESQEQANGYIGTEHILLAILREGKGTAARLLVQKGITLNAAKCGVAWLNGSTVTSITIEPTKDFLQDDQP